MERCNPLSDTEGHEFPPETASEPIGGVYAKEFTVDYVRGFRQSARSGTV